MCTGRNVHHVSVQQPSTSRSGSARTLLHAPLKARRKTAPCLPSKAPCTPLPSPARHDYGGDVLGGRAGPRHRTPQRCAPDNNTLRGYRPDRAVGYFLVLSVIARLTLPEMADGHDGRQMSAVNKKRPERRRHTLSPRDAVFEASAASVRSAEFVLQWVGARKPPPPYRGGLIRTEERP